MGLTYLDLDRVRRELMGYIDGAVLRLFGYTLVSSTSALGDADAAEKADGAADPDGTKGQRPYTRIQPFGYNGVPPKSMRALWFRWGSGNVFAVGFGPTQAYGPQDLNSGDAAHYSSCPNCQAVARAGGNYEITSGTPDGGTQQDVVINGGTAKVARVGDTLTASGPMGAWAGIVEGAINTLAPGTFLPANQFAGALAANPGKAGNFGTVASGADHFKG